MMKKVKSVLISAIIAGLTFVANATSYTISDYSQDGLVAMWDCSSIADGDTTWTDSKGNKVITFTGSGIGISSEGVSFPGDVGAYGTINATDTKTLFETAAYNGTVEIVVKSDAAKPDYMFAYQAPSYDSGKAYQALLFYYNATTKESTYIVENPKSAVRKLPSDFAFDQINTFSVAYLAGKAINGGYVSGFPGDTEDGTFSGSVASGSEAIIGGRCTHANRALKGTIYAIRIYNRRLSPAEIVENARLDKLRFIDKAEKPTFEDTPTEWGYTRQIETEDGLVQIDVFRATDKAYSWEVPNGVDKIDLLVVAGGGSGGAPSTSSPAAIAGGGGAGGLVYCQGVDVVAGTSYDVQVGKGGASVASLNYGINGDDSSFGDFYVAKGGGFGAFGGNKDKVERNGGDGGSGGGASYKYGDSPSAALQPSQPCGGYGNEGAQGYSSTTGGGGGGAGSAAGRCGNNTSDAAYRSRSGAFGAGMTIDITGEAQVYAVGGQGGLADTKQNGFAGRDGFGDGGSAAIAKSGSTGSSSGKGGDGVVIVRYVKPLPQTLTVTPNEGYLVSLDDVSFVSSISTTVYADDAVTVYAKKDGEGVATFEWTGLPTGAEIAGDTASATFTMPNEDVVISVEGTSTIARRITTSVDPAGCGTITGGEDITYPDDAEITLTATANAHYRFVGWTVNGVDAGAENPLTVMMDADKTVTATFGAIPQKTLTLEQPANGTITADPSATSYDEGSTVTLTATAASGYRFVRWTDDAEGETANPLTITMDEDKTVGAVFEEAPYSAYEQQNLIAIWDSSDVEHITASGWTDTSGRYTFTWSDASKVNYASAATEGISFKDSGGWGLLNSSDSAATFGNLKNGSLEIVITDAPNSNQFMIEDQPRDGKARGIAAIYWTNGDPALLSALTAEDTTRRTLFEMDESMHTFSFGWNAWVPAGAAYIDGTQGTLGDKTNFGTGSMTGTYLGRRSSSTYDESLFQGKILSIRLYSSKLTAEQIKANAAVDYDRFTPGYALTIEKGENGSITADPETATYKQGTEVTLTAKADDGYYFAGWTGDLAGQTMNPITITMDAEKTVGANFVQGEPPKGIARADAEGRPARILVIGNSFSIFLGQSDKSGLAAAAHELGRQVDVAALYHAGCTLAQHWLNSNSASWYSEIRSAFDSDENPFASYASGGLSLAQALEAVDWDVITLQQGSPESPKAESYETYLGSLIGLIAEKAPNAEIKFHQTWAYSRANTTDIPFGNDIAKRDEMYDQINAAVTAKVGPYGLDVIPSGYAVQLYRYRNEVIEDGTDLTSSDHHHLKSDNEYIVTWTYCQRLFGAVPMSPAPTVNGADIKSCAVDAANATDFSYYGQGTIDFSWGVTFKNEDGSIIADQTVTNNATATPPAAPSREHYIFKGWAKDGSLDPISSSTVAETKVVDSTTYTAVMEIEPLPPQRELASGTPGVAVAIEGGWSNVITKANNRCEYVIAFTNVGEHVWRVPKGVTNLSYLVVGGGGGGGAAGGGGGAGGFVYRTYVGVKSEAELTLTVGAGGIGGQITGNYVYGNATSGGDSSIAGVSLTDPLHTVAKGGGFGGKLKQNGGDGGSGGGASGAMGSPLPDFYIGGKGTGWQGNNGGSYSSKSENRAGGGGGGAGAAGTNGGAWSSTSAGKGGDGLSCSITGEEVYYAGGGGGGNGDSGTGYLRAGGAGGGGRGGSMASDYRAGGNGIDGLGGGGGGSGFGTNKGYGYEGGKGGSGIVIIRYALPMSGGPVFMFY